MGGGQERTEGSKERHQAQYLSREEGEPALENYFTTAHCSFSSDPTSPCSALTHPLHFMSYQPPALPSRGKQNSHTKTECQTPRKAFQCPLPRRGSHYNGAWTSAMSPERGEAISFHLTQFAGPRRRLMSLLYPWSHRYHFPNQVTKLVLRLLQRDQADCSQ